MIVAIHQPNYLPWLGFFYKILRSDVFILLDDAQYSKNSYINRTRIKTPTGAQWLTVPVLTKGLMGQTIAQVKTNAMVPWGANHFKTINLNYGRSEDAGYLLPLLEEVYGREWVKLIDLNVELIRRLVDLIGVSTPMVLASEIGCRGTGTGRLVALCKEAKAHVYLSGSGGRGYQDEEAFRKAGIEVRYTDFVHPQYSQRWGEFVAGLSIIDLLINCAHQSLEILKASGGGTIRPCSS